MKTPLGERCYLCKEPRRWTQGLKRDNQAELCLEEGLAWSLAVSGGSPQHGTLLARVDMSLFSFPFPSPISRRRGSERGGVTRYQQPSS